ncbi:Delta(14)-sterol reductase [Zancudomyces culisetae]|uniref:Delta(14)-sterol reductase n=1 Tax=Zancudomyces culisetae TaxID=1213189 RepID=A0A1R1PHF6_ZANCU|nr:Delta(14)-sterol reductase [Zancudomyces culisetae]|eukprot:OMH80378.1 Delta(14)-sterol reductase [Zancudomyces culisetae]
MYLAYSVFGFTPFIYVADHYLQLATASYIFSTMQSVFLYVYSFRKSTDPSSPETMLALGGNSGSPLYDFFMGRELNPRVGSIFDLKYFCELRPGLIGWVVLNMCLAVKQYVTFGYITNSMVIVLLTQNFYVLESLWNESKVLTTMDITTDGFGWMLSVGDLSWVPFTYTLQARYLSFTPVDLSFFYATCVFLLSITGYLVFRLSNTQKNAFRTNPNNPKLKRLRYIETRAKTKLLVSGWWGLARHINYTGDWLLGLSQCLATGFSTPITYFFSIYFLILLVHRFYRDEHKCKVKYGDDWVKYCSLVPYKFIPYIY